MEQMLEGTMVAAFCAAMAVVICRLLKKREERTAGERMTLITMGIGFGIGVVNKILAGEQPWMYLLYLLGFMLTYTAVVLTLPDRNACEHPTGLQGEHV